MGKKDGRYDLVRKKRNWLGRKSAKYGVNLIKLLFVEKREKPIGFVQFGPINEFSTAKRFYGENESFPSKGWCITCISIDSQFRRKGMAIKLLRHVLRNLKKHGIKTVDAYPVGNPKSWNQISSGPLDLWKRLDFKIISQKETLNKRINYVVRRKL